MVAVWSTEVLRVVLRRRLVGSLNLDLSLDPRIALIGLGVALFTGVATGSRRHFSPRGPTWPSP